MWHNINYKSNTKLYGGFVMKIIVIKPRQPLAGLMRLIFGIKKEVK